MSDIESTIISALKADKYNFEKVLNDVARGYAACGFFQSDNWQEIVNSSFNSSAGVSKEEVNGKRKLPKVSKTKKEVSFVTLKPKKVAMENGVYNTGTAIVQPKKFASDGQAKSTTNALVKSGMKVLADSNADTSKLSSRTLRSGSQQIFEA